MNGTREVQRCAGPAVDGTKGLGASVLPGGGGQAVSSPRAHLVQTYRIRILKWVAIPVPFQVVYKKVWTSFHPGRVCGDRSQALAPASMQSMPGRAKTQWRINARADPTAHRHGKYLSIVLILSWNESMPATRTRLKGRRARLCRATCGLRLRLPLRPRMKLDWGLSDE